MFCIDRPTFLYSFTYQAGQLVVGIVVGVMVVLALQYLRGPRP